MSTAPASENVLMAAMDIRTEIMSRAAAQIYKDVDAVIMAAGSEREGVALTIEDMKRRVRAHLWRGYTDYYLDGQPLVRVFAPTFRMDGLTINAEVKYARLAPHPAKPSRARAFEPAPERFEFVLLHTDGEQPCGGAAYYVRRLMQPHERIMREDFQRLDGSTPSPREQLVCGSCGRLMAHPNASSIVPRRITDEELAGLVQWRFGGGQ